MSSTLVIAFIILGFIALFILLMYFSARSSARKEATRIQDAVAAAEREHRMSVTTREDLRQKVMAFDKDSRKLVLIEMRNKELSSRAVDLNKIAALDVVHTYSQHDAKNGGRASAHVIRIELVFQHRDKTQLPLAWAIYDELYDHSFDMKQLEHRALHWKQLLAV
ncbi:hypothetical protein KTO58_07390 [Chitinophaga pendula]|uniref:hypothetical protein n=1 Tax=Chitinophaga TaxID=79328 RepID=UPI000BB0C9F3|nr:MULTISPECIES: hypothetical protein [Chitinophaga]ASZ13380.1 hypothetical protein CK934_21650 [Chitinophaga sp. MD30]UCJ08997.1 hypothetical protein KTO58_07390 [Chitinophaga pendula]